MESVLLFYVVWRWIRRVGGWFILAVVEFRMPCLVSGSNVVVVLYFGGRGRFGS